MSAGPKGKVWCVTEVPGGLGWAGVGWDALGFIIRAVESHWRISVGGSVAGLAF